MADAGRTPPLREAAAGHNPPGQPGQSASPKGERNVSSEKKFPTGSGSGFRPAGQAEHLVRAEVRGLMRVAHGSVAAAELAAFGLTPAEVVDFSVNTNPLGPSASVLKAIAHTNWRRYPGDDEQPLRAALAHANSLEPSQVALGNGSAELLWLLMLALVRPGDRVAVRGPTFGEYARAAGCVGAEVVDADLPAAKVAFVCNPNNPTSTYVAAERIEDSLASRPGQVLVLDEAYASFVDDRWPSQTLLGRHPNLVVLRSLTKDHAVPGLRLGFLLAAPEIASAVEAVRPPWSVNAGALRAGLAALGPEAQAHLETARQMVRASRQMLVDGFSRRGLKVTPPRANFVLVEVGDGASFRRALLPRGLVVRDCASFGLPAHVRVACRPPDDCQRLLEAVG
jgi:histidinol-phosphate aminotransferase